MTENLESLAEEGMQEWPAEQERPSEFSQRILQAQKNVMKLVRCDFCKGHGVDPSKWAGLWGYACWVCGGWGSRKEGPLKIRGPLAPHPNR